MKSSKLLTLVLCFVLTGVMVYTCPSEEQHKARIVEKLPRYDLGSTLLSTIRRHTCQDSLETIHGKKDIMIDGEETNRLFIVSVHNAKLLSFGYVIDPVLKQKNLVSIAGFGCIYVSDYMINKAIRQTGNPTNSTNPTTPD